MKEPAGGLLFVVRQARPGFFEVTSRLTGETHEVKVNRGRFVGPCACGAERRPPFEKCEHQEAVRRYLMERAWSGKLARRTRPN